MQFTLSLWHYYCIKYCLVGNAVAVNVFSVLLISALIRLIIIKEALLKRLLYESHHFRSFIPLLCLIVSYCSSHWRAALKYMVWKLKMSTRRRNWNRNNSSGWIQSWSLSAGVHNLEWGNCLFAEGCAVIAARNSWYFGFAYWPWSRGWPQNGLEFCRL